MKNFKENFCDYEITNPASLFYEFGITPRDIEASIIDTFSDFFQNKEALQDNAISNLVNTWFAYLTIYRDSPGSLKIMPKLLYVFNGAKQVNPDETYEAYSNWFPEMTQSISRFWSLYNNQRNLEDLCNEDFLEESLRVMGQTIEGLSKPFIKLLFQLNRIKLSKPYDLGDIKSKDLGVIIDELLNTSDLRELLIIEPNLIRLNQWRNIAYHHNSKIVHGKYICWYKKDGVHIEFNISKGDLMVTLQKILLTFNLIRICETIFCIDNYTQIQNKLNSGRNEQINIREEGKLLDFYSLLSAQGFKATDLHTNTDLAILKIQDLQEYPNFQKRAIHSTQFIYNLWILTQAKRLIIEFHIFDGSKFLTAEINSSNFMGDTKERMELSKLLANIEFTFVTLNFSQSKDPFDNFKLTNESKEGRKVFHSQIGRKISPEEFARQFTLSIFTNYLAFQSEGLKEINISIGVDGSIVRGQDKTKNILMRVPASIKSKSLQIQLIELLKLVIELYEKRELRCEIVEEAKDINRYYLKKSIIRQHLIGNAI